MLVQQEHARLQRHGDGLGLGLPITRVKHRLAADAALGRGREVQKQRPGRARLDGPAVDV